MSDQVVFIPPVYRYRTEAEIGAEAVAAKQTTTTLAPAPEEPADLDTELNRLDAALATLDELSVKDGNFPAELAAIEAKHKALIDHELDSVEAIQSRSAEMSKLGAMRELGQMRQKKLKAAIAAQQKAVIEIGGRAANLLEKLWWDLLVSR
jgi:hypothetical protein